jgi:hypothetical protein
MELSVLDLIILVKVKFKEEGLVGSFMVIGFRGCYF